MITLCNFTHDIPACEYLNSFPFFAQYLLPCNNIFLAIHSAVTNAFTH